MIKVLSVAIMLGALRVNRSSASTSFLEAYKNTQQKGSYSPTIIQNDIILKLCDKLMTYVVRSDSRDY